MNDPWACWGSERTRPRPSSGPSGSSPPSSSRSWSPTPPRERTGLALIRADKKLRNRTDELAAANRSIRDGIDTAGSAWKRRNSRRGGERYAKLLQESQRMQDRLRRLLHQLMSEQEDERMDISRKLQEHIAQTLLSLNIRLLTLKQRVRLEASGAARAIEARRSIGGARRRSVAGVRRSSVRP